MKQITLQFLLFLLCVSSSWEMSAQQTLVCAPKINFHRCLGGSGQDSSIFATVTSTGDYLFIGNTTSTNGDVVGNHGGKDIWMVKVNASGTILAQACYGGSNNDYVKTVKDLGNDEYLLSGVAQSGNGNVVGYSGTGQNDWTLKINASGAILWQQCADGATIQSIVLANGNLLTINWIASAGTANNYHGGIDSWVKIINVSNGNILLNKCYGGTGDDKLIKVWEESGAIFMGGATNSTNGDITGQHGGYDIWVLKIDAAGNILNQNVLGGSDQEYFKNVYKNSFGNYVIDAYTGSQDGNIGNFQPYSTTTFPNMNSYLTGTAQDSVCQFWSLMLTNTLALQWEKTLNNMLIHAYTQYLDNGMCFENSTNVAVPSVFTGTISFNSESIPTYDGGIWVIGQTYEDNSSGGSYVMHYFSVKISSSGLIQSNVPIHQESSQELTSGGMTYYLTSNATMRTSYNMTEQCPTCGFGDQHYHSEINAAGQFLSQCDTTNYYNFPSPPVITYNTVGTCPISVTAITPAYSTGTLSQVFSSTSFLQNDTCSSGAITHISNNDSYSAMVTGQASNNNWSLLLYDTYIHKIDCKPDGVFALANTRGTNMQAVGNHGLSDIWLLKIEDPNNIYGGKLWKDNNSNTIFDVGDEVLSYRIFKANLNNNNNNSYLVPTDIDGRYRIATGADTLDLTFLNPPLYHTYTPNQLHHVFTNNNNNIDTLHDVVLTPVPNMHDMRMSATIITLPGPGFDSDYVLTYKNDGTVAQSGSVRMYWNNANQVFVSATPTPDTLTTTYAAWKYTNMPSLASANINVRLNTVSFNLGVNIQNVAQLYGSTNDLTPSNNKDTLNNILQGAYDPNFIEVSRTLVDSTYIANDGYITYTVHFQNTGTDTAQNIWVNIGGIGTYFYEQSSFEPIEQSHPYELVPRPPINYSNDIVMKFHHIMLPDSGANQAASNGFFKFRMKIKNYVPCYSFQTGAGIYFDNNPPIYTNIVPVNTELNKPVITVNGPTQLCKIPGLSVSLSGPLGMYAYTWSVNNQHTQTTTIYNPPVGTTVHQLTVQKTQGCSAISLPVTITVNPLPTALITNTSSLTFCDAYPSLTLQGNAVTGASYAWSLNGNTITGATNSTYAPLLTGSYTFTVVDSNGCSKTSIAKSVTANPSPTVAIAASGSTTQGIGDTVILTSTATSGVTYQWQKNNANISGATNDSLFAKLTGNYRLIVKTSLNCKDTSNVIACDFVGLEDSYLAQSLQVYPNPASQNLNISFEKMSKKVTSILLTNALGQVVYEKNIAEIGNIEMTIDVTNFSEGVYRLELKGEEGQASKNIVVLNP